MVSFFRLDNSVAVFPLKIMQFDKLLRVDVFRIASLRRLHIEKRIESLGLVIPSRPVPKGNYINCIRVGNTLQVCGHIPLTLEGSLLTGRIGETMSIEEGMLT